MSLTVEDGSTVAGADSYVTATQYQAWADARFGAARVTMPANDDAAELLILRAMDYFESLSFCGYKIAKAQPLQFPRSDLTIDGFYINPDEIPSEVVNSIYELTYAEEKSIGLMSSIDRATKIEKVGALEVEYMDNAAGRTITPAVTAYLRKLVKPSARVVRI